MTGSKRDGTRGRGALSNPGNRYAECQREEVDDGWQQDAPSPARTTLGIDTSRRIISCNASPDIPFDRSLNPYRGCEHGCVYCYARPSHAWLGLSPGLDFETHIFHKPDAARQLRRELGAPAYRPAPLALGANTDPYQPIERHLGITRAVLEVLHDCRHPVFITTKSALILRDLERLQAMARVGLVAVRISITTLDPELARRLEPRAASPLRRLATIHQLAEAGIPVGVLASPLIPGLTDSDLEQILTSSAEAGATMACSQLIRLPHELAELFEEWLQAHYPARAAKVLSLIRQCRAGRLNDPRFGHRHTGSGPIADLLRQRFVTAARRAKLGIDPGAWSLDVSRFRAPRAAGVQLPLFESL
jgi:DNA repair photolyase